ncbi:primosomal protein N' [Thermochromatium tepidum]|uniref:Replication restart protein PriA n=1 Tax=Thermochromatium tepidum ATCC 43061 TaxID=316276 RepID=A0A6I6E2C1_THETI|nr:primosomal protein N' [Thermochromatium tepidum]QGU34054.1 primosomal protein N' [Thermochromatium tepidum ATCC 43061]
MDRAAIWRVAVEAPLADTLDYLPPLDPPPAGSRPGLRLLVPFGRGARVGILIEVVDQSAHPADKLRRVERVLDPEPLFDVLDLRLLAWAAAYYQQPLGAALFAALPARLRTPEPLSVETAPGLRATESGRAVDLETLSRAPKQRALLDALRSEPEGLTLGELTARLGDSQSAIRTLRSKGWITDVQLARAPDPVTETPPLAGPELHAEQQAAVEAVQAAFGAFGAFLLDGVTGSGKTEVYIRLIESVIAQGRQALVVVPEIGLTPQLRERFRTRLPGPIAVLHSALKASERERNWLRAARGEANLILGTRSAVLAPIPRLGLIVVDEEHDDSFKQQDGLRYSGRDLAVRRAQLAGCPVVLGSATPSLETLRNAKLGRYGWLRLTKRAGGARAPTISILDIRNQPLRAGLSPVLRAHMHAELAAGNQILLFLNRRGYAPVLTCHACGWVGECPHCDARLTLHLSERRLWCHHCGWSCPQPDLCPACRRPELQMLGRGTERLEEELVALFPETRIARLDRDSTRRRGELGRVLDAVHRGEIQILLGTQMLAKGHDFPGVTLVGVLELDQALYASDFRAAERIAQLIVQVAGRAGRAERPGRVVLQTRHPEHPLLQSLLREGYSGFAEAALRERAEAELPPYSHLALARAESPNPEDALAFLRQAHELGERLAADSGAIQLLGPIPAPMERRAGRHRAQLLIQCAERPRLQGFLTRWVNEVRTLPRRKGLRWSLDVDPRDLL